MHPQRGYSMIELLIVVCIISLMVGAASIAGVSWVNDSRFARVSSELADQIILARERAISNYEKWTITFDGTATTLSHSYLIRYCKAQPAGGPDPDTCSDPNSWKLYRSVRFEGVTGMNVRNSTDGTLVSTLNFGPDGLFHQPDTTFAICGTEKNTDGTENCTPRGRSVRLHTFTGRVEE